jgi:hypothetical protein
MVIVDEPRGLVLHDDPVAVAEPGAASCLGTEIEMLFSLPCCKRLTAPSAIAEDTEKTAVFLYSNVKECGRTAPVNPKRCLAKCYNVTLWGHISPTLWTFAVWWVTPRSQKMGRKL